jgi:hypothetical protein
MHNPGALDEERTVTYGNTKTVTNCGEEAAHPNIHHKDTKGIYKEDKKMRYNCHKKKHIKRDYGNGKQRRDKLRHPTSAITRGMRLVGAR